MLLQSWAAVAVSLILVMVNLVNAENCFVPDTTWEAEINHGITNVATKVSCFPFKPLQLHLFDSGRVSNNLQECHCLPRLHPLQRKCISFCQLLCDLPQHPPQCFDPLLQLCEWNQLLRLLLLRWVYPQCCAKLGGIQLIRSSRRIILCFSPPSWYFRRKAQIDSPNCDWI